MQTAGAAAASELAQNIDGKNANKALRIYETTFEGCRMLPFDSSSRSEASKPVK